MANTFPAVTLPKGAAESRVFLFDFTNFPEIAAGETISSASVPSVSGLTLGAGAVTTAVQDGIAAGKGVTVTIAGGTAGTGYTVKVLAATSGGAILEVRGVIAVG